ncbi:hypothetical protein [uncultured Roseobacter sp.]|uniref:hypothetical protein n=1 Tax=uncultured Roseobacter sp. TaxID=114847 RepID=UPI0026271167|nr:hypothetical protein [uncultured Roseobacter sp.]
MTNRKMILLAVLAGLTACAPVDAPPKAPASTPPGPDARPTLPAELPAARVTNLPSYTYMSRKFRNTGVPKSERDAANLAPEVGDKTFKPAEMKIIQIDDYRIGLKHVRSDIYDFIVVQHRGADTFGAGNRGNPWHYVAPPYVEAATDCYISDSYFRRGGGLPASRIFVLDC